MDAKDDAAALDQLHHDFVEAFRSNDPDGMGHFFTETAVLLPPRRPLVSGKKDVVDFWQGAQRMQDLAFEATDVELLGDHVLREAGNLQLTVRGEGRENVVMPSKYVALWVKVADTWKLDSLVWNGASSGQAGARRGGQRAGAGGGQAGYGQGGGGGYGQRAGAGRVRQGGGRRGGGQGGGGGYGGGGRRGGGGGQAGGAYGGGAAGAGGGGPRGGAGAQGGGGAYGQGGGGGYGQRPGGGRGRPGGGGQGGGGPGGGGQGGGGGGFGRRMRQADDDAPMVPRTD